MDSMEFFAEIKRIVDPTRSLSVHEVIKLVEEKFTSTNSAIDAIALLSRCADHICGDVKLTPTAQVELLRDIEQYEQQHQ